MTAATDAAGAPINRLRSETNRALEQLSGFSAAEGLAAATRLAEQLRDAREYGLMGRLTEAISRIDPNNAKNRRLYVQYLIEAGQATVAIDVAKALARRLPKDDPEYGEATGLLGRAYKQIFFDARDKTTAGAQQALKLAIEAYRGPYEADPANVWHGVNLVALLANARRLGIRVALKTSPVAIATQLVSHLEANPAPSPPRPGTQDEWYLPTLAEAQLAKDDWDAVERSVRAYAAQPGAKAFLVASTLRQFTKVWNLEDLSDRGRGLVGILRARLMELSGGELQLQPSEVSRLRGQEPPSGEQLEAVLGERGAKTFKWWTTGLSRALAVVSIRQKLGGRIGTGFLIRAVDLGITPGDELLILTNHHVVNANGASPGIRPEEAEVVFEAVEAAPVHEVREIVWSSPVEQCDACVLRLNTTVSGINPLPVAKALPTLGEAAQVYVIGYVGGRDLAFSFQDNELLDHEGPPAGKPQIPGVCRVHYRAPTEGGSSGSPVFNASLWEVIALHHKGGKTGMPRLNGASGTYAANEGIALRSILETPK
jgi:hypothetical protein